MKRALVLAVTLGWMCTAGAAGALAQAESKAAAPAAAAKTDNRQQFLDDLKDMEAKLVGLAEAMPQDKYSWRPGEGVRSVSEVFLHLARGYFGFPKFWGVQPPADIALNNLEKSTTDKAKVVETLKQSFAHMRQAAQKISDADLEKPVDFFGEKTTLNGLLFIIASHLHEHLGQAIAYARMNNVVPPWTAERQAKQAATPKK